MEDLSKYELKVCLACDGRGWKYLTDMSGNNTKSDCKICLGNKQLYYSDLTIMTIKDFIKKRELKFKLLNENK